MSSRIAVASAPSVAEVATTMFSQGNALDAVVAGVLAACALHPGVLLGPVQILVGGPGVRLCAIDGRVRQPGLGADRPRGFRPEDAIPPSARIGTPCLPAALAVALAMCGSCTFLQVTQAGLELAKCISDRRYRLLTDLGRAGPSLLTTTEVSSELIAAAGKVAGGNLTREDLEAARPEVQPPHARAEGDTTILSVPWTQDAASGKGETEIVAASDDFGLLAIACYEAPADGLHLDELGLLAPFMAAPVLRGEPRVAPGLHRAAPAPIELRDRDGWLEYAIGVSGAGRSLGIARSRRDARPYVTIAG